MLTGGDKLPISKFARAGQLPKSGAKATALQTLRDGRTFLKWREASGVRRVHRRFSSRLLRNLAFFIPAKK
jgi:hypothetical protein